MTDISVKIMAELLSVFALATKQIKQGRFSEWIVIFTHMIAQKGYREIREEAAWRKRDRGCATKARPSHPRGGPNDRR